MQISRLSKTLAIICFTLLIGCNSNVSVPSEVKWDVTRKFVKLAKQTAQDQLDGRGYFSEYGAIIDPNSNLAVSVEVPLESKDLHFDVAMADLKWELQNRHINYGIEYYCLIYTGLYGMQALDLEDEVLIVEVYLNGMELSENHIIPYHFEKDQIVFEEVLIVGHQIRFE